jgi:hypothetical protein
MLHISRQPGSSDGNRRRFKYTPEAWAIIAKQQRTSEYIFPKERRRPSLHACEPLLAIQNLRFHYLRHESTNRPFERSYQIHGVGQFTLAG